MLVTITRTIDVNVASLLKDFRKTLNEKYGGTLTDQAIADILVAMAEMQQTAIDFNAARRARLGGN